jgi:hypothetical protein
MQTSVQVCDRPGRFEILGRISYNHDHADIQLFQRVRARRVAASATRSIESRVFSRDSCRNARQPRSGIAIAEVHAVLAFTNFPVPGAAPMTLAYQDVAIGDALRRMKGEYLDLPGLRLTAAQAQRLWGLDRESCEALLGALVDARFLCKTRDGAFSLNRPDSPR